MKLFGKTPSTLGCIHFVGIGGIGMSALAEFLFEKGYHVQGSDASENANVKRLKDKGIHVFYGHAESHVDRAFRVVISTAVKNNNPELMAAEKRGVRVMHRSDILAEILKHCDGVAISGTHGKTTTTALTYTLLESAGKGAGVINGGIIYSLKSNMKIPKSNGFPIVVEADESDASFTKLLPRISVITNMDPEHLDFYGDEASIQRAYKRFALNTPEHTGTVILGTDSTEVVALKETVKRRKIVTFGFNEGADFRAINVQQKGAVMFFTLRFEGVDYDNIRINMPGKHNVLNALAAMASAMEYGLTIEEMKAGLLEFRGVGRRFIKLGEFAGTTVIDDYAHHPVEVDATLKAARGGFSGKVVAIFQPHRFTRLKDHLTEFSIALAKNADIIIVAPVYAAGEYPIEGVSSSMLEVLAKKNGANDTHIVANHKELVSLLPSLGLTSSDVLVFMGAGNINQWAQYAIKTT